MKRRKKEFGLYNILGMGKRNIGIILVWESLIIALFSLAVGLFIGIAISKLAELALVNILNGAVKYSFSISPLAIVMTVSVFGAIFLLLLLNSIRQIRFSNTAALLRSENLGEKPPKGNIFIGILGILLLGGAYWLPGFDKRPDCRDADVLYRGDNGHSRNLSDNDSRFCLVLQNFTEK